jgi:predicted nucleic acid-binding protein
VRIARRYHFAFYDCLILAAGLKENCKIVFSEDMKDGQIIEGTLKIVNPFKDNP